MAQFDPASHVVPHGLEDPVPIMFWSPMVFCTAACVMAIGIVMNLWLVGFAGGFGVLIASQRMGRGAKKGASQHILWSLGLQADPALKSCFPHASSNDLIE